MKRKKTKEDHEMENVPDFFPSSTIGLLFGNACQRWKMEEEIVRQHVIEIAGLFLWRYFLS